MLPSISICMKFQNGRMIYSEFTDFDTGTFIYCQTGKAVSLRHPRQELRQAEHRVAPQAPQHRVRRHTNILAPLRTAYPCSAPVLYIGSLLARFLASGSSGPLARTRARPDMVLLRNTVSADIQHPHSTADGHPRSVPGVV